MHLLPRFAVLCCDILFVFGQLEAGLCGRDRLQVLELRHSIASIRGIDVRILSSRSRCMLCHWLLLRI